MNFPRSKKPGRLLPRLRTALALSALAVLAACTTVEKPSVPEKPLGRAFERVSYSDIPVSGGWSEALSAFRLSCPALKAEPWIRLCTEASSTAPEAAEAFFKTRFAPWRVTVPDTKKKGERTDTGLMTGYYEPLLRGSRTQGGEYQHPVLAVPDDLLVIDLASLYPELKGLRLRGKLDGRRVVPYDPRGVIQDRTDLPAIAWVDDPVDLFFLHIQGSGRIALPDGSFMRVGFADQNGWRYRSISGWLIKHEGLKPEGLSMQRIRAWAKANPSKVKTALAENPSFVFFEERRGDPALGPLGAQGVPLTPLASVAVDPREWRLGTPFIVEADQARPELHFTRPVVAQDTGGAIRGTIRFDYFWGFGEEAGQHAGRQKSAARAWVLVPAGLTPEDIIP
ncbi:murein transglycosylase A [Sutterella sp.]|uniref:murein transglycosylase A n=1 Tax=Sutterella sp. TaxID=1981025 RepID=UPI0026DEBECE|nr:murein transglycosylase A [Sutterella sp.]MDO5532661.1 murein transglycosylase A [Sutterella sp.]